MIDRFGHGEFAQISDMEMQITAGLMFLSAGLQKHISAVSGRSCGEGVFLRYFFVMFRKADG